MQPRARLLLLLPAAFSASAIAFACGGQTVLQATDAGADLPPDGSSPVTPTPSSPPSGPTSRDAGTSSDAGTMGDATSFDASADGACMAPPLPPHAPICSPVERDKAFAAAFVKPILLPNRFAGIDLAGPSGSGLTLAAAEKTLCDSQDEGDLRCDGTRFASWGDNGEVYLSYAPLTGIITGALLFGGYAGTLDFKSADAANAYQIGIDVQITKNGQPLDLPTGWTGPTFEATVDELYRAIIATYAPATPQDAPGVLCTTTTPKKCVIGTFGDLGYVYVPTSGVAVWVPNINGASPVPSTPNRIDVDFVHP